MKRVCLLLTLLLPWPTGMVFADSPPAWSLEFSGGELHSSIDEWSTYYGDDQLPQFGLALAYKIMRGLEVGIETGYLKDRGQGFAPGHGIVTGSVKYQLIPVQATVTLRGIFNEDQWLVPYLGAAAGRFSYRITSDDQGRISGGTDGFSYRAGLQLLLDHLDRRAAASLKTHFGIDNTYLILEARESEAEINGVDLGGTAYLGGLLLEF